MRQVGLRLENFDARRGYKVMTASSISSTGHHTKGLLPPESWPADPGLGYLGCMIQVFFRTWVWVWAWVSEWTSEREAGQKSWRMDRLSEPKNLQNQASHHDDPKPYTYIPGRQPLFHSFRHLMSTVSMSTVSITRKPLIRTNIIILHTWWFGCVSIKF